MGMYSETVQCVQCVTVYSVTVYSVMVYSVTVYSTYCAVTGEEKNLSREMHHAFLSTCSLPIGAKLDQCPFGIKDRIRFLTKYKISCSMWARFL